MKVAILDCFHQIAFKTELSVCFRHAADRIPARMQICPHRPLLGTARCGRANPGSVPGSEGTADMSTKIEEPQRFDAFLTGAFNSIGCLV